MREEHSTSSGLRIRGRIALLLTVATLGGVFWIAMQLYPYDEQGNPRKMETHTQLGLPPCSFRVMTGKPCPTCGMSTSFSHFVRWDFRNSWRANAVGLLIALCCVLVLVWSVISLIRGRLIWVRAWGRVLGWTAVIILGLTIIQWVLVVGIDWMIHR